MIPGHNHVLQAVMGTLFTWALTALGAALVFVFRSGQRKILDGSLGFAAGVMTAASYWSLLAPAIEMAGASGLYGDEGQWSFIPVSVGFAFGALFVYAADVFMPSSSSNPTSLAMSIEKDRKKNEMEERYNTEPQEYNFNSLPNTANKYPLTRTRAQRRRPGADQSVIDGDSLEIELSPANNNLTDSTTQPYSSASWKRILLLIIAITVHNIPEGLAVGVGFGAIGKSKTATFENARNLAIGIGIQNFPEGLAVSLPLRGAGLSTLKSFWYGQLSGMVEPVAGLLGAFAVVVAEPLLPYALSFAAGAMIFVVVDDIVPEAQTCGNGKLASFGCVVGFIVMMSLDVGLG